MLDEAVVLISNWQPLVLFILPLSKILDLQSRWQWSLIKPDKELFL